MMVVRRSQQKWLKEGQQLGNRRGKLTESIQAALPPPSPLSKRVKENHICSKKGTSRARA